MKRISPPLFLSIILLFAAGCTSQKKLAYLNNLPEPDGQEFFQMDIPDYKLHPRDILYVTIKAMTPDGKITDFLTTGSASTGQQDASSGYLTGIIVNKDGFISIPAIGNFKVEGLTLEETKTLIQKETDRVFKNTLVDCKLLSFKFTVIGEVDNPGTYVNYNSYLTVLEAVGRAGGIGDFGNRQGILVIRPFEKGTKTFKLNLQDKNILSSEAYFLLPNDVVIVQPLKQKIFNQNLPTIAFIVSTITSTITMTLLLVNYLSGK